MMNDKWFGLFLGLAVIHVCGCMNGYYKVNSSVPEPKTVPPYVEVDALGKASEMNESEMPVVVRVEEGKIVHEESSSGLWVLSLGVIPYWDKYSLSYKMTVQTPIGKKEVKYTAIDKYWFGWIPCIIPCPGWADDRYYFERTDKDYLKTQLKHFGDGAREHMVRSVVGQFKMEDYVTHVRKEKRLAQEAKARELARVAQKKAYMAKLLLEGKYEQVIAECEKESPFEAGKFAQYSEDAKKGIEERAHKEEVARVAKRKGEVEVLLANGKFDEAIAASSQEQGAVWEKIKEDAKKGIEERTRKEEAARLAKRKAEFEQLLSAGKFEQVIAEIAECEKESPFEAGKFAQFLTDAKQGIAERDRKAELERIAKRKADMAKLLSEGKYEQVIAEIAECEKESPFEAFKFAQFLTDAEQGIEERTRKEEAARLARRKAELEQLLSAGKYEQVIVECEKESPFEAGKFAQFLNDARQKIAERDRSVELARIAKRKAEVQKMVDSEQWGLVIVECKRELAKESRKVGWMPEDDEIWTGFKQTAEDNLFREARTNELARIASRRKEVDELMKSRKFNEAVKVCNQELLVGRAQQGHKDEDDKIWKDLEAVAERELSRARDKELARIDSRKKEIEILCENKKWDAAIAVCDEEENANEHNEGWHEKDRHIWRSLRLAIASRRDCERRAVERAAAEAKEFLRQKAQKDAELAAEKSRAEYCEALERRYNCKIARRPLRGGGKPERGMAYPHNQAIPQKYQPESNWSPTYKVSQCLGGGVYVIERDVSLYDFVEEPNFVVRDPNADYVDGDELEAGWYLYEGVFEGRLAINNAPIARRQYRRIK